MPDTIPVIPARAAAFLAELMANNATAWFAGRKAEYDEFVRGPLARLAEHLAPAMSALDPLLALEPAAVVSRIRRDVRFARDKSPFRGTQWLAFKRRGERWSVRPAFFMEFGPDMFRHGMGFYAAGAKTMAALRELAQDDPRGYEAAVRAAREGGYELTGEVYKRPRVPGGQPASVAELFRRRGVCMVRVGEPAEALENPKLPEVLARGFAALAPLYRVWLVAADRADAAAAAVREAQRFATPFPLD